MSMKIVAVNYYTKIDNGSENTPVILIFILRRKEERGGKKVESSESKKKRKVDGKKIHKRKERKAKTALEILLFGWNTSLD